MTLSRIGKMSLAAGAVMVAGLLGSAAPAAADWHGHRGGYYRGGGGYYGGGFYAPPAYVYDTPRCYIKRVWVRTYYGPQVVRRRVCRW